MWTIKNPPKQVAVIFHFQVLPLFYRHPLPVWWGHFNVDAFPWRFSVSWQSCSARYSPRVWHWRSRWRLNGAMWCVLDPELATGRQVLSAYTFLNCSNCRARQPACEVFGMERFFFTAFCPRCNSFSLFSNTASHLPVKLRYKKPMLSLLELEHRLIDLSEL